MRRNLIYYVCPFDNEEWKLNVDELLKYIDIFDGRKIACIATSGNENRRRGSLVGVDVVKERFNGLIDEFFTGS